MPLVKSVVSRLDAEIDQVQLSHIDHQTNVGRSYDEHKGENAESAISYKNLTDLKSLAQQLSSSSSNIIQQPRSILRSLKKARNLQSNVTHNTYDFQSIYERDALWLVVSKASVLSLGLGLTKLLDRVSTYNNEASYWNGVISSDRNIALYTFQTWPIRLWRHVCRFYSGLPGPGNYFRSFPRPDMTVIFGWNIFYESARRVADTNLEQNAKALIYTPYMLCKSEAVSRLRKLKVEKKKNATGIGLLLEEFFSFGDNLTADHRGNSPLSPEWHNNIFKSVVLLDAVFQTLMSSDDSVTNFEEHVFFSMETAVQGRTNELGERSGDQHDPFHVIERLILFLETRLAEQEKSLQTSVKQIGRPAWLVRYWIPVVLSTLSIGAISRLLTSNMSVMVAWFREVGLTIIDFWGNWVIGPIGKLIGTIRHDEESEIALMSRNSLVADRASLERMVFDFVRDHQGAETTPESHTFDAIVADVREGDLTPVLKAYERDLRRPFMGAVRGDLVRALLIQVQKTKVDVEIAIGGINSLLKSQELVFGFVGLTPGILVSYAAARWIIGFFTNKSGLTRGMERYRFRRTILHIDKILNHAASTKGQRLSYKDHGLLCWEIHQLDELAKGCLPESILRDFKEDVADLSNVGYSVGQQLRVVTRMQWAYSKWM